VLPAEKLAVLAGPNYVAAPGQDAIGFYGTDLGISLQHGRELRFVFGDTWSDPFGTAIGPAQDDAQASIALDAVPDGSALEAQLAADANADAPFFERAGPPLRFELNESGSVAGIELYRGGFAGQPPLDSSVGKAVVAAFSNTRDGAFIMFRRDVPVACSGTPPSCDRGFECDTEMGFCSNSSGDYPKPCVLGSERCGAGARCERPEGGGLCQDRTSSLYAPDDEDARVESLVLEQEIGNAAEERPYRYLTRAFRTNKFTNAIVKPVIDFDPERDDPEANDYRPADGSNPERERALMWGRPHSVAIGADGRDSRLYFAYSDMPRASDEGPIGWEPHYLAAVEEGRPVFSDDPSDAIALDLGGEPLPESEQYDIVMRMGITYLPELGQWLMLYGGDLAPAVLNAFVGPSFGRVRRAPDGGIHARFARHPWGPWSAPVPALQAGDPSVDPPRDGSEYAEGGMLRHPGCSGDACIPGTPSPFYALTPYGFLYGANIIDAWTEPRDGGRAVDVYWNVSTWNPYQVVLLKTRVELE
jgi:hypothetical protein